MLENTSVPTQSEPLCSSAYHPKSFENGLGEVGYAGGEESLEGNKLWKPHPNQSAPQSPTLPIFL